MAAAPSASKPATMRAAVLYQAMHLGAPLKEALRDNGVEVVYESTANRLDVQRIQSEGVQVFVINLDPELEEFLDEVTDVLDRFDRPVIFNDANSSASLSGWDQARWARHLAAKIRGELTSHPPRPVDAPSIPVPPPSASRPAPVVAPAPVTATETPVSRAPKPTQASPPAPAPSPPPASPPAPAADPFADLDALLGVLGGSSAPAPQSASQPASPPELDLDALFDSLGSTPASTKASTPAANADLDALLGVLEAAPQPRFTAAPALELDTLSFENIDFSTPATNAGTSAELTDLDALFQQLESKSPSPAPETPAPAAATPAPPKPAAPAAKKEAPSHWSLTPLDEQAPTAAAKEQVPAGRAQFKIDDPLSKPAPAKASSKPAAAASDSELPALDFEIGDFMLDLAPSPAPAAKPAPVPPASSVAKPAVPPTAPAARAVPAPAASTKPATSARTDNFPDLGLSADEFEALGFDTITAPAGRAGAESEPDPLADLDDIFAELDAPPATPTPPARGRPAAAPTPTAGRGGAVSLPDLNRIFVLGASIGGPEAVRTFLAGMKPGIGAGFVLAQHMGAEFIELMAAQLDKASPVRVRVPIDGERFRHGEVIVVPVGKRLTLDAAGHVVMGTPPAESPYSPSIDQVLMDMADRFGSRCTAIVFSGMASDAVEGCKYLHTRGGQIWVQDPNTCVISSMIDGAQAAGVVGFVGSPEALAQKVLKEVL